MIEAYLIELSNDHPWLLIPYVIIMTLCLLSMVVYILLTVVLLIVTRHDKKEIFSYFVKNSPDAYKQWIGITIRGWMINMAVPFLYWRMFSMLYDMKKEEVKEWRNIVKNSFGSKRYAIFRIRLIANNYFLLITIPLMIMISIDMFLAR
ncbi:TPA: hypothetical protein ACX6Q1_003826 [Photobacterium damselae]